MNRELMANCLALLQAMNSGQAWTDGTTQMYALVLKSIGAEYAREAVEWAVLNEDWRPSPARLRQIAARLASPYPDSESAYGEIIHKAQTIGSYGRRDPDRPNIYYPGPPAFSHPMLERIVGYCGSWESICSGEANMQEGLKKQVRAAHDTLSREWEGAVMAQLALPAHERDGRYFPRYAPYALPSGWSEEMVEQLPRKHVAEPMPDDVKRLLAGIGKPIHNGK